MNGIIDRTRTSSARTVEYTMSSFKYHACPRSHVRIDAKLLRGLAAELVLRRDELLDVRVRPQGLRNTSIDRRQRLARQTAVAVDLLDQPLRARDAVLRDSEVTTSRDALQPVRFGEQRGVLQRSDGQLLELDNRVLMAESEAVHRIV